METGAEAQTCAALRREIERSIRRAFDPSDVLPRLVRLARLAPPSSEDGVFAHRQLAELLVERHPWRAALYARRVLAHLPEDDRAWAILAFSQTLLGNFHCAETAYRHAIAAAPTNPWYAHNLGHLLDVALGAPQRAIPWLRSAYAKKSEDSEFVASYVHALARAGQMKAARAVLERALRQGTSHELEALQNWVDEGAPSHTTRIARVRDARDKPAKPVRPRTSGRGLTRVLQRGLAHLPLDARQCERARILARDLLEESARLDAESAASAELIARAKGRTVEVRPAKRVRHDLAGLAAAVAYAIVYVDHVPLSQAEVAAPFRVPVGRLRGRFAELRARLDIIRGDARYASTRGR